MKRSRNQNQFPKAFVIGDPHFQKEMTHFFETYKKDVKKYNDNVALYNKTIQRYNILIKQ